MSNKSYIELLDKFGDKENIFILGAGPSLYKNTLDSFFPRLKEYGIVICVNSSIMACKEIGFETNVWLSNDALCRRWSYYQDLVKNNSKIYRIVRNSWLKYKDEVKNFYIFCPRSTSESDIDFEEQNLIYPSSVPSALDFSIQCENINKIFLLGVDQCLDKETGYHHFWENYPISKQPKELKKVLTNWGQQKKVFKYNNMSYKALKEFAEYKNVEIYNCNPESSVKVFPKIKFEEIIKIIKEK